jgi:uncharacterized protein YndB with AHSA1/START domain
MTTAAPDTQDAAPSDSRELVLTRILKAPRGAVYRCWTEPKLITQWFAPKPFTTPRAETDLRPGGASLIVMAGPDGVEMPNRGVYLEVVPSRKLVFTDAYVEAWKPSANPFMTVTLTFEDAGPGQTRYTARVVHWTDEARAQHEQMGFHTGWGLCADQLEALAASL